MSRWGPRLSNEAEEDGDDSSSSVVVPPSLPPDADFTYIQSVEWGLRVDEEGYDVDQELAPRPKKERTADPCGCRRPTDGSTACLDDSCILHACQEECRSNCEAGEFCGNKRLQRHEFKQLQVFDAGLKGYGLRLLESCQKGDLITEYVGQAVLATSLSKLFRRYQYDRMLYIMALGDGVYIDARKRGGLARYINHSCQPNAKVERWKVRGVLRAAVIALSDMEAGTEVTFDYQWERKRGRAPTKCHCNMPNCRGTLEVAKSMEESNLERELQGHWKKLSTKPDQTIVNRTVQVFSKEHQEYFLGEVTGYKDGQHCILYRHDMNEVWEDLTKEDWMVLDEKMDKEHFIIAKKIQQRPASSSLLSSSSGQPQQRTSKNYVYVQTPIKEAFWSKHLIERCERNCQVQIQAQQMARPPLPVNANDPEDVEKYQALDQSLDGTVWKLTITGSEIARAYSILQKNVIYLKSKLESEKTTVFMMGGDNNHDDAQHELIYPRIIADAVKRKLPLLREKCRSVNISFVPSESKSKQFCRLILEGSLLSDINLAKEHLWTALVNLCVEANAPVTLHTKIPQNLGFLGGALSSEQFRLLCNTTKDRLLVQDANEDLRKSSFFVSFESTYRCTVWVQSQDDKGRIDSTNHVVGEARNDSPRKVYFGCDPKEVSTRWAQVQSRAIELERGVKFLHLGADRVYQPLMMKNGGQFFEFVKQVTGAAVNVDSMTGDHLRIDGRAVDTTLSQQAYGMAEQERAALAEELIRLQIELYRDQCIREHNWIFGRDWTLTSHLPSADISSAKSSPLSFGQLDSKSAAQGCMEISEIVAHLGLGANVAVHAAIILYRFVSVMDDTQMKVREAALACSFLASKCQKVKKWKKLESILEAGYKTFYPGTAFDKKKKEVVVLEEKVIASEKEILEGLRYDIFLRDIEWIVSAARGAGKMKENHVQNVLGFAFSGQALAAGVELWLKYGVEYVFAVSAAFLKANLDDLLSALALIPLKVSQAAELFVECAKVGRPASKKMPSHPLLERSKVELEKYLPRIKEACVNAMKKGFVDRSGPSTLSSATEQRYRIISERSRRRHSIRGIPSTIIKETILPVIGSIAAESTCSIYIGPGMKVGTWDIVLDGPWRAVAIAEHLLRSITTGGVELPASVDSSGELKERLKLQAKVDASLLKVSDIQTTDGWDGTIQPLSKNLPNGAKIGGKSCIAGKVSESVLRESGLRWWIPPKHGPSPTGAIHDLFALGSDPSNHLDALASVAKSFVGSSESFPNLTSRPVKMSEHVGDRSVAISLQRWPSEKVSNKEIAKMKKSKGKAMQLGFSAAALQEMELLTQLHSLIPSPHGHPNFVLPISIALPADEEASKTSGGNSSDNLLSLDDPMFSLFRSTEDNEKAAKKEKKVKECAHLVMHPTPFVLSRFLSRKKRDNEQLSVSPAILAVWFHDLLSALVHCHSNHVVLRTIQADQIVIDQSGVAKLGSLYRATVLSPEEREKPPDPLEEAKSSKKKKEDDEDFSSNTYAAPEILLGSPKFGKESDVWAMGCLLAHLLLSKPLILGKDRSSLLTSQYKIVGTPAKDNFEEGARFPNYLKPKKKYPRGVEKAIEHMMKDESSQHAKAIDLISRMLHLDPKERCTAAEALGHEYMVEYIENCQSDSFRKEYVASWMALKERLMRGSDSEREVAERERNLKRKAMLMAATADDEEDDLYDMDDLLEGGNESAKKAKA